MSKSYGDVHAHHHLGREGETSGRVIVYCLSTCGLDDELKDDICSWRRGAPREHHLWIPDLESETMAELLSLVGKRERIRIARDREVDPSQDTRLVARLTIGARGREFISSLAGACLTESAPEFGSGYSTTKRSRLPTWPSTCPASSSLLAESRLAERVELYGLSACFGEPISGDRHLRR